MDVFRHWQHMVKAQAEIMEQQQLVYFIDI